MVLMGVDAIIASTCASPTGPTIQVASFAIPSKQFEMAGLATNLENKVSEQMKDHLLLGRYSPQTKISDNENGESWIVYDQTYAFERLARVWPFRTANENPVLRALWLYQLRILYRISSSPNAEESLVRLRDAGIDQEIPAFVMILEAKGYDSLKTCLANRPSYDWLDCRKPGNRRRIWAAVRRLSEGINLLHAQRIFHRNIDPDAVVIDSYDGPGSMRLGGFEWSVRLGTLPPAPAPTMWAMPPELTGSASDGAYSPETDWFLFGALIFRLFTNYPAEDTLENAERGAAIRQELKHASNLTGIERDLILSLLEKDASYRILGDEVPDLIKTIEKKLSNQRPRQEGQKFHLAVDFNNEHLRRFASENSFVPDLQNPKIKFSSMNPVHSGRFKNFMEEDLAEAKLYPLPRNDTYLLVGKRFFLRIRPFVAASSSDRKPTWDIAYCFGLGDLRGNHADGEVTDVQKGAISVLTISEAHHIIRQARTQGNWQDIAPRVSSNLELRAELAKFQSFLRVTHQLELLLRAEEILPFELMGEAEIKASGFTRITIRQGLGYASLPDFHNTNNDLYGFVLREVASGKPQCNQVELIPKAEIESALRRRSQIENCWSVDDWDDRSKTLVLVRETAPSQIPQQGVLRTYGFGGQITLIERRDAAITRLKEHAFLLRSLTSPDLEYLDLGPIEELPVPVSRKEMDKSKQAVLRDILRTRPLYCLQGPPGTGKTTLVKYLLRQIFAEERETQILITAQANPAVDVLRERVEALFANNKDGWEPLAVRLSSSKGNRLSSTGARMLATVVETLGCRSDLSSVQLKWIDAARQMLTQMTKGENSGPTKEFLELLKRSANIIYCTTSARDLETLAESRQSFDWSIVEEAGKAHGFDLALPLQAGHRWLLIGDHKQLPAFGYKEFLSGVPRLPEAVDCLEQLPDPGRLLDREWLKTWRDLSPEDRAEFIEYAKDRLPTFKFLLEVCGAFAGEKFTRKKSVGALAGGLAIQHRMHPKICAIISDAFYDGKLSSAPGLQNKTRHPFRSLRGFRTVARDSPGVTEPNLQGVSVLWIDLPWSAKSNPRYAELGVASGHLKWSNPEEVRAVRKFIGSIRPEEPVPKKISIAVLAPYNQQVRLLNDTLADVPLPHGVVTRSPLLKTAREKYTSQRIAYTVDQFQGNEADVVVVSLVRNNESPSGRGMGFLEESPRLNVLLSRAERLLVLVGSWEFFSDQVAGAVAGSAHLGSWRSVMDSLESGFQAGWALKVRC